MLLMGLMRNVAITGSTDSINAWYGRSERAAGRLRTAARRCPRGRRRHAEPKRCGR